MTIIERLEEKVTRQESKVARETEKLAASVEKDNSMILNLERMK